jgi:L-fucose mutarotase
VLKGINPLLSPELLKLLCGMGHGDEIVLADANFTAESLGRGKTVLRLPGVSIREACAAVLSVFPLDDFVKQPVAFMQVGGTAPGYRSELQREVIADMSAGGTGRSEQCEPLERFSFYERVTRAYAIVQTGEMQAWSNFLFKKGVIAEDLRP